MFKIETNIGRALGDLYGDIKAAVNDDKALRAAALSALALQKRRIFVQGLRSDGAPIGKYSKPYLAFRQKISAPGGADVIFVLTDQLRKDYTVGVTAAGDGYALGFNNPAMSERASILQWGGQSDGKSVTIKGHTWTPKAGFRRGYGRVFGLSADEAQAIYSVYAAYLSRLI